LNLFFYYIPFPLTEFQIPSQISALKSFNCFEDKNLDNEKEARDPITPDEIFNHIRHLNDPEHPLTLEQLHVVNKEHIIVEENNSFGLSRVSVQFTPTIPHCSMATLIGLSILVKLNRSLSPRRFKVSVSILPGSHSTEEAINRQLGDKERVAAALENSHLLDIVNKCIGTDQDHA
jgi:metal-sulfur cluster biosynthetic enzyme